MKKITAAERKTQAAYQAAKPKFLGNLHERMKEVLRALHVHEKAHGLTDQELRNAIYDLEIEVQYHQPAKPPYGRRLIKVR